MSVHTFELVRNFGNDSKGYRQFKELREFIIADSKKNGYQFPYKERKNPKIPKFKGQGIRVVRIRQLIPRLYKYPEKCYNNHKVQRSPRKSRDSVEQDGS